MALEFAKVGLHQRIKIKFIGEFGVRIEGRGIHRGDIVDVPVADALVLFGRGIAVRYAEPPKPPEPPKVQLPPEPAKVEATPELEPKKDNKNLPKSKKEK